MILVVNKVDRPDARIAEVVDEVYELFLDLDADEAPDRVPDRLLQRARPARAGARAEDERSPSDLAPLMDLLLEHIPAPHLRPRPPAAGARHQPRRLALRRPPRALPRAQRRRSARASRSPGAAPTASIEHAQVGELYVTEALDRVDAEEAGPGRDHRRRRHRRGDDRRDARRPRRPAAAAGDHRRRAVAVGDDRHQHLAAGRPGRRQADRAPGRATGSTQELVGNVSLRVARHRAPRRLGGPGPRRAAARGPRRDHAPRGLRADRRPAAGAHARDRRQASTSRSSG